MRRALIAVAIAVATMQAQAVETLHVEYLATGYTYWTVATPHRGLGSSVGGPVDIVLENLDDGFHGRGQAGHPIYSISFGWDPWVSLTGRSGVQLLDGKIVSLYAYMGSEQHFYVLPELGGNVLTLHDNDANGPYEQSTIPRPPGDWPIYVPNPAIPEPGTWAMLLAGLGLTGVLHRRRSRIGRVREPACTA